MGAGRLEGAPFVASCQAEKELQHFPATVRLAARVQKNFFLTYELRSAVALKIP